VTDDSFRLDTKNLTATMLDHLFAELHDGVEVESFDIRERAACGDGVASTADRITLDVSYRENGAGLPGQIILKTLLLSPVLRLGLPAILSLSSLVSALERVPLVGGMASRLLFVIVGIFQKFFPQAPDAMYEIESRFYNQIRPGLDMEAPRVFGAHYDGRTRHFAVLMEDLALRGARFPNALESLPLETVRSTLSSLARLHAQYWNSPELDTELSWVPTRFEGGMYPVFDGIGFDLIRYQVEQNAFKHQIIAPIGQTVDGLWDGLWRSQRLLASGPRTLLHGDTHLGNSYVLPDGSSGLLDFQLLVKGNWCIDVSYYLITALDTEARRRHEAELIEYYLAELDRQGVTGIPDFEEAWHDHRLASIWGLVIGWLITPPVNYGEAITAANIERTTAAVIDLDALAALEVAPIRKTGSDRRTP
jgi:hypothetical protein